QSELAGFVINLDDDVLAEVLEGHFRTEARPKIPNLVCPLLELFVMCDTSVERDGIVLGAARRFAAAGGVASLTMFDNLSGAFQRADLADAGHVSAVPLHAEFEVLVRIEALCIDGKLGHYILLPVLHLDLTGHLLDLDDHELGGFERCEPDDDVDD